jgi:hypothetical protein
MRRKDIRLAGLILTGLFILAICLLVYRPFLDMYMVSEVYEAKYFYNLENASLDDPYTLQINDMSKVITMMRFPEKLPQNGTYLKTSLGFDALKEPKYDESGAKSEFTDALWTNSALGITVAERIGILYPFAAAMYWHLSFDSAAVRYQFWYSLLRWFEQESRIGKLMQMESPDGSMKVFTFEFTLDRAPENEEVFLESYPRAGKPLGIVAIYGQGCESLHGHEDGYFLALKLIPVVQSELYERFDAELGVRHEIDIQELIEAVRALTLD